MAEKVTSMVLTVDLDCCKCYKKVKKVLCKFLEIHDQVYDKKNNKVTIKVVCCSPEKIRDKICCEGGGFIKSIEIVKPREKPEEKPKEKPQEKPKKKPQEKPEEKPKEKPAPCYPPVWYVPFGFCCSDCYTGRPGGPCYNPCYGQPVTYYDVHCAIRPVYDSWGGGGGNRCYPPPCSCSECFFEVSSQGCTTM